MTDSVNNPNASQNAGADGSKAQDIDSLISQYETSTTPVQDDRINKVLEHVENEQAVKAQQQTQQGINDAVKTLKEGSEAKLPDRFFRGAIHDAAQNPDFVKAFENRETDPGSWNTALKSLSSDINSDFKSAEETSASQTQEEIASALRGSVTQASGGDGEPDYASMSDAEFEAHRQKAFSGV